MTVEKDEYIQSLEKRIEKLENILEHLCIQQCKEISMSNCLIGDFKLGNNCNITMEASSVGSIIPDDIEGAEGRIADLECSLEDVIVLLEDAEARFDGLESKLK